jgi:hypothetical protein
VTLVAVAGAALLPASAAGLALPKHTPGALAPTLAILAKPAVQEKPQAEQARLLGVARRGPGSLIRAGGRVLVYVDFDRGAVAWLPALRRSGARVVSASRRYQRVTASVQLDDLAAVGSVPGVVSVAPVRAPVVRAPEPCEGGSVISEGVQQLNVEGARATFPGADGDGLTVGVLSDSFDQAKAAVSGGPVAATAGEDEETRDLPGGKNDCLGQEEGVHVLEPYEPKEGLEEEVFDEGRGMLQIVHDIAPQANLAFHSAFNGEPDFAEGIEELAEAKPSGGGADVIVDDVAYFEEPFFQDGPVAAAVNKVVGKGVAYLSAAGNDNLLDGEGDEIASWEAPAYRDSGECPQEIRERASLNGHHCLDFNPGPATDRTFGIRVEPGEVLSLDLQWAEPWDGVLTDLDAFLLDAEGRLLAGSVADNIAESQQPTEIIQWDNTAPTAKTVQLVVNRFAGSADPRLKFILLQNGGGVTGTEYPRSGGGDVVGPSIYGHAGAPGAIAVGAMRYAPRLGEPVQPEEYSSRGPVTHYFGQVKASNMPAAPLAEPLVLSKPDVTATDCGRTTFFAVESAPEVWRFCGTSAAAPHAAGVATLMLDEEGAASPDEIREALVASAAPIVGFGPCAVGGGLVEARGAIEAILAGPPYPAGESCEPPESLPGEVFVAPGNWGLENPPPVQPPVTPPPPTLTPTAPQTAFAKHPKKTVRIRGRSVKLVFRFRANQAAITFLCKVDKAAFRRCGAKLARTFKPGHHLVKVKARNSAGLTDPTPAVFRFEVERIS